MIRGKRTKPYLGMHTLGVVSFALIIISKKGENENVKKETLQKIIGNAISSIYVCNYVSGYV